MWCRVAKTSALFTQLDAGFDYPAYALNRHRFNMSFQQLRHATGLRSGNTLYWEIVDEWASKRQRLMLQLDAMPGLVQAYRDAEHRPYPNDARFQLVDPLPWLQIATACESIVNSLYSMAELATHFANRVSGGALPSSFNKLRKKAASGELDPVLTAALGDLQWYGTVREIRTEWAHFSSVFILENAQKQLLLSVKAYRRPSDKAYLSRSTQLPLDQLLDFVRNAIATIDAFGTFLVKPYVIPMLDLAFEVTLPIYDAHGLLQFMDPLRIKHEKISIKEYLRRGGIET